MPAFVVIMLLVVAITSYMSWHIISSKRLTMTSCAVLINELRYVDVGELCTIARDVDRRIVHKELIQRLGGLEGVERLSHNAKIVLRTAQYLAFIDPQARSLAESIRDDAMQVRRIARLLIWQERFKIDRLSSVGSAHKLCLAYVMLFRNHVSLCECLVDEVLDVSQHICSIQRGMLRADV